jgi:hypothetical protein
MMDRRGWRLAVAIKITTASDVLAERIDAGLRGTYQEHGARGHDVGGAVHAAKTPPTTYRTSFDLNIIKDNTIKLFIRVISPSKDNYDSAQLPIASKVNNA